MKKVTEKDLSLDKQEVSALSGVGNNTRAKSDYCTESGVNDNCENTDDDDCLPTHAGCHDSNHCNLTDSAFEECCDETVKNCPTIDPKCPTLDHCPESDDETDCAISDDPDTGCMTPIPETQHC